MNCCQCQGIEDLFNEKTAARELADYRKKGPARTTRMLIDALKARGVEGRSLIDIGGGVGAIQHALLRSGAESALDIDASQAYINAARQEAARQGFADRARFWHGNFVDLAPQVEPADIVTLDRVLCCYPDVINMVKRSAERARWLYGVVYPRDTWIARAFIPLLNLIFKLQKSPFRTFIHPTRVVEDLLAQRGFRRVFAARTLVWQVIVYERQPGTV